ncbi:MAG: hypothetical protein IKD69_13615 [Solobacterium sp.]|nr:hypothetical protein [Solobacterium sp.]
MGWRLFTELGEEPFDAGKFEILLEMMAEDKIDFVGLCRDVSGRDEMFLNVTGPYPGYDLTLEVTAETGDHIYEKTDVGKKEMMEEVVEPLLRNNRMNHPETFRHTFRRKGDAALYEGLLKRMYEDQELVDLYRRKTGKTWFAEDFASALTDLLWEKRHLAVIREDGTKKEFEHDISYLDDLPEHLRHVDENGTPETWLAAIQRKVRQQGKLLVCLDIDNPGYMVTLLAAERAASAQRAAEGTGITLSIFPA